MVPIFSFLSVLFFTYINAIPENVQIIRSKKFDCSYIIAKDIDLHRYTITKCFDDKEFLGKPIEFPGEMTYFEIMEEEQFESLMCYCKNDPNALYVVSFTNQGIQKIDIASLMSGDLINKYVANADVSRLHVHAMTGNKEQLFLAVSDDEHRFGEIGSFIVMLHVSRSLDNPVQLTPLFILPITKDTVYVSDKEFTMHSIRSLLFDTKTQKLFCGFDITTDNHDVSSLSALICAFVDSKNREDQDGNQYVTHTLHTTQVPCDKIISHDQDIVKTNRIVSVKNICFMNTSTALHYIIYVHHESENLQNIKAHALSYLPGIASKHSPTENIFFVEGLKRFVYRTFKTTAEHISELKDHNDEIISVGGQSDLLGTIEKIKVFGDTVCVLTRECTDTGKQRSMIYRSVALFESSGKIKGWTHWRVVYISDENVVDFELDRLTGHLVIVYKDRIRKSGWELQDEIHPLVSAVQTLTQENHYIQDATIGELFIHGKMQPLFAAINDTTVLLVNLETIKADESVQIIHNVGIGALQHVSVAYHEKNKKNYSIVTGKDGIAEIVLDDHGVVVSSHIISDIPAIKKIIIDNEYIYALSDDAFYRACLISSIDLGILQWENLITPEFKKLCGELKDIVVSDSCALLLTLKGLWKVRSGYSVKKNIPEFEKCVLPQQIGIPISLFVMSPTHKTTDFGRFCGGNIFVLCTDFSLKRSQVYRIAINPCKEAFVNDDTLTLFDDVIFKEKQAPFLNFGSLQETFFTDGFRFFLFSSNQQLSLSPQPRLGIVMSGNKLVKIPQGDFQNARILYTGINPCTGELLVSTEHGVQIYR